MTACAAMGHAPAHMEAKQLAHVVVLQPLVNIALAFVGLLRGVNFQGRGCTFPFAFEHHGDTVDSKSEQLANRASARLRECSAFSNNSSSMLTSLGQKGCSNRVEMQLLVNGASLSIAQMGPDFLLLDKTIDHPPGEATIVFSVEGSSQRRWQVRLPEGLSADCERVVIAKAG